MNDLHHHTTRLGDALRRLAYPSTVTDIHGTTSTVPGIIDTITDAMSGTVDGNRTAGRQQSRPPLWIPALDWRAEAWRVLTRGLAMTSVAHATTLHPDLIDACDTLLSHRWAPDQADGVRHLADQVENLANAGERIAHPPLFTITAPCPACGAEKVEDNTPALTVRPLAAECAACGTRWTGASILDLAHHVM